MSPASADLPVNPPQARKTDKPHNNIPSPTRSPETLAFYPDKKGDSWLIQLTSLRP